MRLWALDVAAEVADGCTIAIEREDLDPTFPSRLIAEYRSELVAPETNTTSPRHSPLIG